MSQRFITVAEDRRWLWHHLTYHLDHTFVFLLMFLSFDAIKIFSAMLVLLQTWNLQMSGKWEGMNREVWSNLLMSENDISMKRKTWMRKIKQNMWFLYII